MITVLGRVPLVVPLVEPLVDGNALGFTPELVFERQTIFDLSNLWYSCIWVDTL